MAFSTIRKLPSKVISALEEEKILFHHYTLLFFFAVVVRYFIESLSQSIGMSSQLATLNIANFTLSYIAIIFMLGMIVSYACKEPIVRVFKVLLAGSVIIVLQPVLEMLLPQGQGISVLFNIEIATVLAMIFFYLRIKNINFLHDLGWVVASYFAVFVWGSSSYIAQSISNLFGGGQQYHGYIMLNYFAILDFFLLFAVTYLADKKLFNALAKDIRGLRIGFYMLSLLLGAAIALSNKYPVVVYLHEFPDISINLILSLISLFFACLFALMINNINDINIDKISNSTRPLVTGEIDAVMYARLSYLFMFISMMYAWMVNLQAFIVLTTFMGAYFMYSAYPIRFKRVLILSKFVIGFNSFALLSLGYGLTQRGTQNIPSAVYFIFLIGITAVANFIDLKDVDGDKAAGIKTLPIVVGEKNAKKIIGAAFVLLSLSYYFLIENISYLPLLVIMGMTFYYVINKKTYEEWKVLVLCDVGFLFLIFYFLCEKGAR